MKFESAAWAFAAAIAFATQVAHSQNYPEKTVRIVGPAGPAGSVDIVARLFAEFLPTQVGQNAIVENVAGAQTLIGARQVARAAPDGHTLLFAASISAYPVFSKDPQVEVARDFEFVSMVMRAQEIVAVSASRPWKTVADLAAYSKANPDKLNYASYGQQVRILTETLRHAAGITGTHIPFSSAPPAVQAVASGDVDFILATIAPLRPLVASAKIRLLAVTTNQRSKYLPDIPAISESGIKVPDLTVWMGAFAPRGTPRPVVDKLNAVVREFIRQPQYAKRLEGLGFEPYANSPEEFRSFFVIEQNSNVATGKMIGIAPE